MTRGETLVTINNTSLDLHGIVQQAASLEDTEAAEVHDTGKEDSWGLGGNSCKEVGRRKLLHFTSCSGIVSYSGLKLLGTSR